MIEYYDGIVVMADDIIRDFEIDSRNEFLKRTSYYSKDGKFVACVYDNYNEVTVERNE